MARKTQKKADKQITLSEFLDNFNDAGEKLVDKERARFEKKNGEYSFNSYGDEAEKATPAQWLETIKERLQKAKLIA